MVRKFCSKVSGNSENCSVSEIRTIQKKISDTPRGKSDGTEIPGNRYINISCVIVIIKIKKKNRMRKVYEVYCD